MGWPLRVLLSAAAPQKPAAGPSKRGKPSPCGRRVEVNIKSRDLAVPGDDEIHTGVLAASAQAARCRLSTLRRLRRPDAATMAKRRGAAQGVAHTFTLYCLY
jgi:hypothetical protein